MSVIKTNGINQYESIKNEYFEYNSEIYKDIHNLKEKIHSIGHLEKYKKELDDLRENNNFPLRNSWKTWN